MKLDELPIDVLCEIYDKGKLYTSLLFLINRRFWSLRWKLLEYCDRRLKNLADYGNTTNIFRALLRTVVGYPCADFKENIRLTPNTTYGIRHFECVVEIEYETPSVIFIDVPFLDIYKQNIEFFKGSYESGVLLTSTRECIVSITYRVYAAHNYINIQVGRKIPLGLNPRFLVENFIGPLGLLYT